MEQNTSQAFSTVIKLIKSNGTRITELGGVIGNCRNSYLELFRTGSLQSSVNGARVTLDMQASVCGDILVLYHPIDTPANKGAKILDLIQTDVELEQQKDVALKLLRQKYKGLMALPEMLIWALSSITFLLSSFYNSANIHELFSGKFNITEVKSLLPVGLAFLALFFSNTLGFLLLKPIAFVVVRSIKLFKWIRNNKPADFHDQNLIKPAGIANDTSK